MKIRNLVFRLGLLSALFFALQPVTAQAGIIFGDFGEYCHPVYYLSCYHNGVDWEGTVDSIDGCPGFICPQENLKVGDSVSGGRCSVLIQLLDEPYEDLEPIVLEGLLAKPCKREAHPGYADEFLETDEYPETPVQTDSAVSVGD